MAGGIRSEYTDMSNKKSCEMHDRRKFTGFYRTIIVVDPFGPLENSESY